MLSLEPEMTYRVRTTDALDTTYGSPLTPMQYWQVSEATLERPRIEARLAATGCDSMRARKPGGAIVVSGSTSGPNPGADLQRLFFLQLRVLGSTMGTRNELADLLTFVTNAGISPAIGLELPLERAEEGFRAMEAGETVGKIVFTR